MTPYWMPVVGIDPSLRNFGMVRMSIDLNSCLTKLDEFLLVETEKEVNKTVRRNSDDLLRCQKIIKAYHAFIRDNGIKLAFSEVPTGAQSARAMFANGVITGLLASCPIPLIQVQPSETKMATVGTKTASKEEMIEWAGETYPNAPWLRHKSKGVMVLTSKNEHLADAAAVVHAGMKTDQFQQLRAIFLHRPGVLAHI